uniref:Amidohydrolase 2 n=1 Tax=uncultured bacterium AZ_40 TaxID=1630016 RepID=A0A0E3GLW9_9BACT|nr:amidohydrolase 2 [uncultured bacterium AZ_40]
MDVHVRATGLSAGRLGAYLVGEGVDVAVLTGGDGGPARRFPGRLGLTASPHLRLSHLAGDELCQQIELGAVAYILDPAGAGVALDSEWLYPGYAACQFVGVPLIVTCGARTFPGANPTLLGGVLQDFPDLDIVLAGGGQGWPDEAAAVALASERVWIELSGLFLPRLRGYYAHHDWTRLTRRMIFGSGWPAVVGIARHARAAAGQCPDDETAGLVLAGNAARVFHLNLPARLSGDGRHGRCHR